MTLSSSSFGCILLVVIVATIQTLWISQLLLHRQHLQDQLNENDMTSTTNTVIKTKNKNQLRQTLFVSKKTTDVATVTPPTTKPETTSSSVSLSSISKYKSQDNTLEVVGTFNNHTLTWVSNTNLASTMHCVGDTFDTTKSWMYQSCEFSNLCFDIVDRNFMYVSTEQQRQLQTRVETLNQNVQTFEEWDPSMKKFGHEIKRPITISTLIDSSQNTVSLGGLNINWEEKRNEALQELEEEVDSDQHSQQIKNITQGLNALKWFPQVLTQEEFFEKSPNGGVYMLPSDSILILFHSFGGMNVGHLLWDDFLPLYTLLSIFDMINKQPILLRQAVLSGEPKALWATCDLRKQSRQRCDNFYKKFLPLLGTTFDQYSTTDDFRLELTSSKQQRSRYVCAPHAVVGMGMLTDHALKKHGWNPQDYWASHNFSRGQQLWKFRNHLMKNLGFTKQDIFASPAKKIVISRMSSKSDVRRSSYENELKALEQEFHSDDSVKVESTILLYHSAHDQINLVKDASIFITSAGGGAVTGMFLPRGASVILYYDEGESSEDSIVEAGHLDWDYWNHVGYLRIHWLPIRRLSDNTQVLVELVKEELTFIDEQQQQQH